MIVTLADGMKLKASCECGGDVRRSWTAQQFVMNGLPSGQPLQVGPSDYECATCGAKMQKMEGE